MTFVDADGKRHTVSIPWAIAADLVPLLEQVAAAQAQTMADLTRLPQACEVGHAVRDRKDLLRFDNEPPYAIGLEAAAALGRALQEETECQTPAAVVALERRLQPPRALPERVVGNEALTRISYCRQVELPPRKENSRGSRHC